MLSPMSWTLRFSNSSFLRANSTNSVVQTGVKSAGWEKSTTHLPLNWDRVISPWVLTALKSGAGSFRRGSAGAVVVSDMSGLPLVRWRLNENRRLRSVLHPPPRPAVRGTANLALLHQPDTPLSQRPPAARGRAAYVYIIAQVNQVWPRACTAGSRAELSPM